MKHEYPLANFAKTSIEDVMRNTLPAPDWNQLWVYDDETCMLQLYEEEGIILEMPMSFDFIVESAVFYYDVLQTPEN